MNLFLPYQDCLTGLNQLDSLLSTEINQEDGDAVAEHIAKLASFQGYSAKLMASCEYHKYGDSKNRELRALFTLSERLNAALGKCQLSYSTILSRIKLERQLSTYGS